LGGAALSDEPKKSHAHFVGMLDDKKRRQRKPTLRAALEAAKAVGRPVKSATVEDGKVTLVFGESTPDTSETNPWDTVLSHAENPKRPS
jgi:hypothetical protein